MGADFKWYGEEAKKHIKGTVAERIEKACILLKNATKEELSKPYPPASAEGEPPHRRTGQLRRSVAHDVDKDKLVGRVGTNVKHGKWLELGTKKMGKRPWLSATMEKMRDAIKTIMEG